MPGPESAPQPLAPGKLASLTLADAISLALRSNPDLSMALARREKAQAEWRAARGRLLPLLSTELSYLRADAPSMYLFKTIDAGRFQQGTDFNDPGAFGDFGAELSLQYNIYNGGRDGARTAAARQGLELAHLDGQAVENELIGGVIDAWYSALAARELVETTGASEQTVLSQLQAVRARFDAGSALKTDVLSLEVRYAEAQELSIQAHNGEHLALAVLAHWMGVSPEEPLTLDPRGAWPLEPPDSEQAALERGLELRPEVAMGRARVLQAREQQRVARAAWYPRADVFAKGWRDAPEFDFDDSRDNWALGVRVGWDLFSGSRGAGQAAAKAGLKEAQLALAKARLAVELDVKRSWLGLQDAQARGNVVEGAVRRATENLALIRSQFENGAVPITRYLEAELMLTEARMRRTQAGLDLERSRARLARSMGELVADKDSPGAEPGRTDVP